MEELEEAGYEFAEGEEKSPKFVPFFSDTYCDDGILVAPDNERFMKASKASYIGFMEANLGKEAVSMKDIPKFFQHHPAVQTHLISPIELNF